MEVMREQTAAMARALGVVGLINVQYAIKDSVVYVLEVNPRASRTVPFVSKAIGVPLASLAARVMLGETLDDIGFTEEVAPAYVSVKEAVFPFSKFPSTDPVLGPEMRSTGEVMGIADSFGTSFAKAQLAAGNGLPLEGTILVTVNDADKPTVTPIARRFQEMGFRLLATARHGALPAPARHPVRTPCSRCTRAAPTAIDLILNGDVQLLVNTPLGKHAQTDDYTLRQAAIRNHVAYTTTMSAASAAGDAILALRSRRAAVKSLQEWLAELRVEA